MNIKIFIASLLIAVLVSLLGTLIGLDTLLPAPVLYFIIALIAGCLTSYWVMLPALERSPRKKPRKPGKPVNGGTKETGSVKWFSPSKGFGFITRDNGEDIFVHFRSIMGKGHRILQEGQRVEFAVTESSKGLQAEEVDTIT